jgi:hypothetical protein
MRYISAVVINVELNTEGSQDLQIYQVVLTPTVESRQIDTDDIAKSGGVVLWRASAKASFKNLDTSRLAEAAKEMQLVEQLVDRLLSGKVEIKRE